MCLLPQPLGVNCYRNILVEIFKENSPTTEEKHKWIRITNISNWQETIILLLWCSQCLGLVLFGNSTWNIQVIQLKIFSFAIDNEQAKQKLQVHVDNAMNKISAFSTEFNSSHYMAVVMIQKNNKSRLKQKRA